MHTSRLIKARTHKRCPRDARLLVGVAEIISQSLNVISFSRHLRDHRHARKCYLTTLRFVMTSIN